MRKLNKIQVIDVVDGVNGVVDLSKTVDIYYIQGTETLTSNYNVGVSGTPKESMACTFRYQANVTLGGNKISLFGKQIPDVLANKNWSAELIYRNAAWELFLILDIQENGVIDYDKLSIAGKLTAADLATNANIPFSAMADLAADSVVIVGAGGKIEAGLAVAKLNYLSNLSADLQSSLNALANADTALSEALDGKADAGSIDNGDIAPLAGIVGSKLNINDYLTNLHFNSNAALAFSKMEALTAGKIPILGAGGKIEAGPVDATKLPYISSLSGNVQDQINAINSKVDPESVILTVGTHNLTSSHRVIILDSSGGDITLNLPEISTVGKHEYFFKTIDGTSNIVIEEFAGEFINVDGTEVANIDIGTAGNKAHLISDGIDTWYKID